MGGRREGGEEEEGEGAGAELIPRDPSANNQGSLAKSNSKFFRYIFVQGPLQGHWAACLS